MNTRTLLVLIFGGLGIAFIFSLSRKISKGNFMTKIPSPFGLPPTGADVYQVAGPPPSPIASSVGRQVQQIQTGIDAGVGLAKDIKKSVADVRALFGI